MLEVGLAVGLEASEFVCAIDESDRPVAMGAFTNNRLWRSETSFCHFSISEQDENLPASSLRSGTFGIF
jgi:hypothetical protein